MYTKKCVAVLLIVALLCACLSGCVKLDGLDPMESTMDTDPIQTVPTTETDNTVPSENATQPTETDNTVPSENTTQPTETESADPTENTTEPAGTASATPVDINTVGGAVIVGVIGYDEQGWYLQPEQPLNVAYEYFLDNPSVFPQQTRIAMFDPKVDGVEKALYLGQTVTLEGSFRFYRDDFETLYFAPYTVTLGKLVPQSYSAPDLMMPEEPENLLDPSWPLPKYMDPMILDNRYVYNAFMLSEESLQLMGNDFAVFYVGFVDAFLNYQSEFECPEKRFAEMLSTVIYYDFPLYSACAEPIEYVKHYDPETGMLSIVYKYDEQTHKDMILRFMDAADTLLADTSPDKTDLENAKSIYHALCTRVTYDDSALTEFERKESYYAYLYHSGVCVTFANAYNQLLTQVGIKSTLAHCDHTDTLSHCWSVVTLDGAQYFCDPTYELNYDSGAGYYFFGMNFADRTADGLGDQGIRCGRYYTRPMDAEMIAEHSIVN